MKMKINYHNRKFIGISNSPTGQVGQQTVFTYFQHEDRLTGEYQGGEIVSGHLLGTVKDNGELTFVYHHLDLQGKLKSGWCKSKPEFLPDGRIRLHETWQWTYGGKGEGASVVEEIS
jgi:hypothetical protein